MSKEEALFFAEIYLSDKCNRTDTVLYDFVKTVYNFLNNKMKRKTSMTVEETLRKEG